MPNDSASLIERVREVALQLEGASEKSSHGAPAFFVRGRCFFTVDDHHHGAGHLAIWCNAPLGAQEALVSSQPQHFFRPPYVGGKGWVGVRLDSGLSFAVVSDLIRQAHAVTGVRRKRELI